MGSNQRLIRGPFIYDYLLEKNDYLLRKGDVSKSMKIIARRFWGFKINWLTNCLSPYVTSVPCNFGEVESWNLTCTTINHFSTDFLNNQRFQFSVGQFGRNFPISILGEQTHAFKKLNCIFNRNHSNTLKCMPVQSTCCFNKNVIFVGLKYLKLRFP